LPCACEIRGRERRRTDGLDAEAVANGLDSELRGAVDGALAIRLLAGDAADRDDVTATTRTHAWHKGTHTMQQTLHIRVDHIVYLVLR